MYLFCLKIIHNPTYNLIYFVKYTYIRNILNYNKSHMGLIQLDGDR